MSRVEQQLSVLRATERCFDREVVVEEEVLRHQEHRHAVDAPRTGGVVDVDGNLGFAHSQAPHTSFSSRIQFSPITLRMRASFHPRRSIAAVRLG